MNADFIQTLMANNEKARDHALKLNEEVGRLRQRENELTQRVLALLATKIEPTEPEKAFLEWLLEFRLEADEPNGKKKKQAPVVAAKPSVDPRQAPYEPGNEDPPAQVEKLVRVREELKLLSKVKKRETFSWIESRQMPTDAELFGWETHKGIKLPSSLRELYRHVGANAEWRQLDANHSHIHRYSPFLALLPLDQVGWTEVWGQDHEPETYEDDSEAARILDLFEAGHEFDDSFVCEQLCGKDRPEDETVRVLLVGAPLNIKTVNSNGRSVVVNSRMFLNIRPTKEQGKFVGDGLLYRLDCTHSQREEGDSELVKIGTAYDWLESCFISEVEDRLRLGGEKDPLVQRYPWVLERKKKAKVVSEETEDVRA